jgi:hypothetical protein
LISWTKQGNAIVGSVHLLSGAQAQVALVAGRENPKGAVIIQPKADGSGAESVALSTCLDALAPETVIDIICAQERAYGDSELDEL